LRQITDLVEENRRMIGQLEAPDLTCECAGECALLAAEELALHERARDRRAVHPHHDPATTRAHLVDVRGNELFAGARFPEQQDR
jgi:hypothetical protein